MNEQPISSHTIGISHCSSFNNRLYNFTGKGDADPSLYPNYIKSLKKKCPPNDQNTLVEMDPGSVRTFDNSYYKIVAEKRGLFTSDSALLDDSETKDYIKNKELINMDLLFLKNLVSLW